MRLPELRLAERPQVVGMVLLVAAAGAMPGLQLWQAPVISHNLSMALLVASMVLGAVGAWWLHRPLGGEMALLACPVGVLLAWLGDAELYGLLKQGDAWRAVSVFLAMHAELAKAPMISLWNGALGITSGEWNAFARFLVRASILLLPLYGIGLVVTGLAWKVRRSLGYY